VAIDMTLARLREVEGPKLYRGNAFRVVGLPTSADRATVRQRQRRLMPAVEAGADVDLGHDLPVGLDDLRTAFDRLLNRPHARLVDEIFWLWGDVRDDCGCPWSVHHDHDEAVRAHSAALDLAAAGELGRSEQLWATAGQMWGRVLRLDACWHHLRTRAAALDERQLDASIVDALRDKVPLSLLRPVIDLAVAAEKSWLADRARTWPAVPQRIIDELLEEAAADWYKTAYAGINDAYRQIDRDQLEQGANAVYREVVPQLRRLEKLVPKAGHRRTAKVHDDAAVVLANCATRLIEKSTLDGQANARKWYRSAREMATDPQTRQTIDTNVAALEEMVATLQRLAQHAPSRRPPQYDPPEYDYQQYEPPQYDYQQPAGRDSAAGCLVVCAVIVGVLILFALLLYSDYGGPGGIFSMVANQDWRIQ